MSIQEFKKEEVVLKFKHKEEIGLKLKELKKNLLVLGATGTGKTTAVIKPCLESLIKTNSFGLVFDLKGNLYADISYLAKKYGREKDIMFIGTYNFCQPINLLKEVKDDIQLKKILERMVGTYGDKKNEIWRSLGITDIINVFTMYMAYKRIKLVEEEFNLNNLIEIISNKKIINEIYEYLSENSEYLTIKELNVYKETKNNNFSLINTLNADDSNSSKEQEAWRSGVIRQLFNNKSEKIVENFYSEGDFNIKDLLFNEKKIIVVCAKPEEYFNIIQESSYIRKSFMEAVTSLNKYDRKKLKIGEEFNKYSFLLIDEYQGFVNFEKNTDINDELWLSISREYENINIFATQSISSILSQADNQYSATSLLQNFVNKIIFNTQDNETIREHFIYAETGLFVKKLKQGEVIIRLSNEGNVETYERIHLSKNVFMTKEYEEKIENELMNIKEVKIKESKVGKYITRTYLNKVEFDNNNIINIEKLKSSEEYVKLFKLMKSLCIYSDNFIEKYLEEKNNVNYQDIENEINTISEISNSFISILDYKYKSFKKDYTIIKDISESNSVIYFVGNTFDIVNNKIKKENIEEILLKHKNKYVVTISKKNLIVSMEHIIKKVILVVEEEEKFSKEEIIKLIKLKENFKNIINIDYCIKDNSYNKLSLISVNSKDKFYSEEYIDYMMSIMNGNNKILYDYIEESLDLNEMDESLDLFLNNLIKYKSLNEELREEIKKSNYINNKLILKENEKIETENKKEDNKELLSSVSDISLEELDDVEEHSEIKKTIE